MENYNINKPISMIMEEAKQQIIYALNATSLDAYTLEIVLRDIYKEVQQAAINQVKREKEEYEQIMMSMAEQQAKAGQAEVSEPELVESEVVDEEKESTEE